MDTDRVPRAIGLIDPCTVGSKQTVPTDSMAKHLSLGGEKFVTVRRL
jgi:hypothetical protein